MEPFRLHILGCSSAMPTMKHYPACQVLNVREKLFMIDCGEGAQLQLRRMGLNFNRISAIFLSHLHGDHVFGLPGLISTFSMLGRTQSLHIYAPDDLEKVLRPWLDFFSPGLEFEVVCHKVCPTREEVIYDDRSLRVTTLPLSHRIPCCGFRFDEKPLLPHIRRDMIDYLGIPTYAIAAIKAGAGWTDAEGREWPHERLTTPAAPPRSYAYCSDTQYLPALAKRVSGVDLLYHEATFAQSEAVRAEQTCHSLASEAAQIALQAHAKRLLIGHFSARYEDESILLREAQAVFPNTLLAYEDLQIDL
ncbi:MAG: ribonuclease Z [Bacteroidaceae bacterium]|nr:ribonuclease Z [Bacteroidaceae bacterium]